MPRIVKNKIMINDMPDTIPIVLEKRNFRVVYPALIISQT